MRREAPLADRERLAHMLQPAKDAVAIAAGHRREELDCDVLRQHALVHCVQVIGEAATRVGDSGRLRVPDLPWPKIVGMRHILVHDYFDIDYDAVWRVVTEHVPQMIPLLQNALASWPAEEDTSV
ncbi:MAG: HepT-like ribonuclease domain-containing protein [Phycisphaeraceae bacterium]